VAQAGGIVRVDVRVVPAAGDGHVRQAPIDEIFAGPVRVDVYEDPIGGLALTAVAGDRIAVVEMKRPVGPEGDRAPRVEAQLHLPDGIGRVNALCPSAAACVGGEAFDPFDGPEFAIRDMAVWIGRGELDPVADGEGAVRFSIDRDAVQTAGIVGEDNGLLLDAYRFDSLEFFIHLGSRTLLRRAA
jgi:hypothetical protein